MAYDDFYVTTLPNGQTFTCSKLVLYKTSGKCPVHGHIVDEKIKEVCDKQKAAQAAKVVLQ